MGGGGGSEKNARERKERKEPGGKSERARVLAFGTAEGRRGERAQTIGLNGSEHVSEAHFVCTAFSLWNILIKIARSEGPRYQNFRPPPPLAS